MNKWYLHALLLCAALVVLWLATGSGTDGSFPGTLRPLEPVTNGEVAQGPRAPGGSSEPSLEFPGARTGPSLPNASESSREDLAGEGLKEIDVLVTKPTGESLADVRLYYLDRGSAGNWQQSWGDRAKRMNLVKSKGKGVASGKDGRLRLTVSSSGFLITRHPGQFGELEWHGEAPDNLTLVVSTEVSLKVRVEDRNGRPVPSVPVVVVRRSDDSVLPILTRHTTRPYGQAEFPQLRRMLGESETDSRHALIFGFPCVDQPDIPVEVRALPEKPVVMKMPPAGRVRVRVRDERGAPMADIVDVTMGTYSGSDDQRSFDGIVSQRLINGEALFPHVGVGAQLAIRLDGSPDRPPKTVKHEGPRREGKETIVEIEWGERHPAIVGRAVRQAGGVLTMQRGQYQLINSGKRTGGPPLSTDRQGRFRIIIREPWAKGAERKLEAKFFALRGEAPLDAELDLSFDLPSGDMDLGDVLFSNRPTFLSGHVRDAKGSPIFGANIRIEQKERGGEWVLIRDLSAVTDSSGEFTLYGRPAEEPMRLLVVRRLFKTVISEDFKPGAAGFEVVMRPVRASPGGEVKKRKPGEPGKRPLSRPGERLDRGGG